MFWGLVWVWVRVGLGLKLGLGLGSREVEGKEIKKKIQLIEKMFFFSFDLKNAVRTKLTS